MISTYNNLIVNFVLRFILLIVSTYCVASNITRKGVSVNSSYADLK